MSDLIGEKTALEQTRDIISHIDKDLPKALYKKLVKKIYDNQLKKWTSLSRSERHFKVKKLGIKKHD